MPLCSVHYRCVHVKCKLYSTWQTSNVSSPRNTVQYGVHCTHYFLLGAICTEQNGYLRMSFFSSSQSHAVQAANTMRANKGQAVDGQCEINKSSTYIRQPSSTQSRESRHNPSIDKLHYIASNNASVLRTTVHATNRFTISLTPVERYISNPVS